MATTAEHPATPTLTAAAAGRAVPLDRRTPPVKAWAATGAVILAFEAWVLVKWVSGPHFEQVDPGPSDVPGWMAVNLVFWQAISIPVAMAMIWWFVVRPWRRERRVGVDGVLVLAFATFGFQDPLSNQGNHWIVYNARMLNFGQWGPEIPWWTAFGEPGANTAEPLLFAPAAYVYLMMLGAAVGCWAMRAARRRWPRITTAGMIACCFVACCLFDVLVEGLIWMPLGIFEYPGGHWAIFPDTYHKFPLNEMVTVGALFTGLASLRYFTNDRGQTVVERGIDRVGGSPGRKLVLRVLAVTAAGQLLFLASYNIPNTFIGLNSAPWPDDLQKRSYFLDNVCGGETNRLCPAPGVSIIRDNSAYLGADGSGVFPPGTPRPHIVPLDRGKPGPEDD